MTVETNNVANANVDKMMKLLFLFNISGVLHKHP
jgi:hypothetical protein